MTTKHREKDIERFDQWSSTYENSWLQRVFFDPVHQATLALAARIAPQPPNVLDVGCGTGKLLRRARTSWPQAQLIGVDPANGVNDPKRERGGLSCALTLFPLSSLSS